jgi:hypothetical protein
MNIPTVTNQSVENIMEAAKNWSKEPAKKAGRVSKLEPHINTIRYLRSSRHFSYKEIHTFFNGNGISCSYANLLHFVKTHKIGK